MQGATLFTPYFMKRCKENKFMLHSVHPEHPNERCYSIAVEDNSTLHSCYADMHAFASTKKGKQFVNSFATLLVLNC